MTDTFVVLNFRLKCSHCLLKYNSLARLKTAPPPWENNFAAINEALKKEVDRLKIATGEMITRHQTPAQSYDMPMHQIPYSQGSFFLHQPQHGPGEPQPMQMPQLHSLSTNVSNPHHTGFAVGNPHDLSDMLPKESIGQFQGLEISTRGAHRSAF